jgi:hypothetical protein
VGERNVVVAPALFLTRVEEAPSLVGPSGKRCAVVVVTAALPAADKSGGKKLAVLIKRAAAAARREVFTKIDLIVQCLLTGLA